MPECMAAHGQRAAAVRQNSLPPQYLHVLVFLVKTQAGLASPKSPGPAPKQRVVKKASSDTPEIFEVPEVLEVL